MGNRGIAVLKFPPGYGADLALYSHHYGSALREMVEEIVKTPNFQARTGPGNEPYAARILVDQLTKSGRDSELGYGLEPFEQGTDPSHSDADVEVTVDLRTGEVT